MFTLDPHLSKKLSFSQNGPVVDFNQSSGFTCWTFNFKTLTIKSYHVSISEKFKIHTLEITFGTSFWCKNIFSCRSYANGFLLKFVVLEDLFKAELVLKKINIFYQLFLIDP